MMAIHLRAARRRLMVMGAINLVAVMAALAAAIGYFGLHIDWALVAFGAALVAGFAAQIWFIAGLRRAGRGV